MTLHKRLRRNGKLCGKSESGHGGERRGRELGRLIPRGRLAALLAAVMAVAAALAFPGPRSAAFDGIAETVRVGLYFESAYASHKPTASYRLYCASGVSVGSHSAAGVFTAVHDFEPAAKSSPLVVSEYARSGGYAVTAGRGAASLAELSGQAEALRGKGYAALPAFVGGWVLLVGDVHQAENAAGSAINSGLSADFPDWRFQTERLSGDCVSVAAGREPRLVYDTAGGNFAVRPGGAAAVELNGKPYRGVIEFARAPGGGMSAVNVLKLDEYLYGVVPREIGPATEPEAQKAQAVASRTYAVNMLGNHSEHGVDLCDTVHCQVYGGCAAEDERSTRAVDETRSELVVWEGAPALVFYFSSSGGHTENIKYVWGSEYPYLTGVEDAFESGESYHYNWETTVSVGQLEASFKEQGIDIGYVVGIAVTRYSDAGRAAEVTVTGTRGTRVFKGEACRTFVDGLYSQMYEIRGGTAASGAIGAGGETGSVSVAGGTAVSADGTRHRLTGDGGAVVSDNGARGFPVSNAMTYKFVGKGWGHGVGMSQEGAKGMAAAGYTYEDILTHYFPGCAVY